MKNFCDQEVNTNRGSGFMNIQPGENKIRVVSGFSGFREHWIEEVEGKGSSVICVGEKQGCAFCNEDDPKYKNWYKKPSARFQSFVWVIDRNEKEEENKIKILRIGYMVYKQLVNLSKGVDDDGVEDPKLAEFKFTGKPGYDMVIQKEGTGLETTYTVIPQKPEILSKEEELEVSKTVTDLDNIVKSMKKKATPGYVGDTEKNIETTPIAYPEENNDPDKIPF